MGQRQRARARYGRHDTRPSLPTWTVDEQVLLARPVAPRTTHDDRRCRQTCADHRRGDGERVCTLNARTTDDGVPSLRSPNGTTIHAYCTNARVHRHSARRETTEDTTATGVRARTTGERRRSLFCFFSLFFYRVSVGHCTALSVAARPPVRGKRRNMRGGGAIDFPATANPTVERGRDPYPPFERKVQNRRTSPAYCPLSPPSPHS